jgi:hypothetical protein
MRHGFQPTARSPRGSRELLLNFANTCAASAPNLDIANCQQSPAVARSRGKKSQAHSKPFLLQTYRRNMVGGNSC